MVVTATYKYDSEAGQRNQRRKISSALARGTFHALKNFVNTEQCGVWFCGGFKEKPHPIYLIGQEKWGLLARRASHYADGRKFEFWHVTNDILAPKHIQRMLDGRKHYYTGVFGLAMFMVDGDAHEDWQDDIDDLRRDVDLALGRDNLFMVQSDRGFNAHAKIDYGGVGITAYNAMLDRLQAALKKVTAHRKCTVEIKGQVGDPDRTKYAHLAKLPCHGPWSFERLEDFKRTPVKPFSWLVEVTERLESMASRPAHATKRPKPKVGSHTGTNVPAEELARVPEMMLWYKGLSYYLYAMRAECRRKDVALRAKDFQIGLAVMAIATRYKKGKELPSKFAQLLWQQAYADGIVDRPHNTSRWAAIWRTVDGAGLLDVEDSTYWYYRHEQRPGKAMAWGLKPEYSWYERETNTEEDVIATGTSSPSTAVPLSLPKFIPDRHVPTCVPAPGEDYWKAPEPWTAEKEALLEAVMRPQ
jgi:hypothetical protein